jgi:hypothetical protein
MGETLFPLSAAGREIGMSADWLRILCDRGEVAHERDAIGRRLIPEAEIHRLRGLRAAAGRRTLRKQRRRKGVAGEMTR